MKIRDRIRELRRVPASELVPNPKNWRTHPKAQQDALRGVLAEVGMADAVLARELPDGSLMLIDGHLRAETAADANVPVLVLDVSEAEADKILATLDPLAAMADSDSEALQVLLGGVSSDSEALTSLFEDLARRNGIYLQALNEGADEEVAEEADEETQDGDDPSVPPPSGVRMVQLFLDETNIADFQNYTTTLSEKYRTENITDTVMECLKRACSSV